MKPISHSITRGDSHEGAEKLQEALLLLIDKEFIEISEDRRRDLVERLSQERRDAIYRATTIEEGAHFQRQFGVNVTWEPGGIDNDAARALNETLREHRATNLNLQRLPPRERLSAPSAPE